MTSSGKMKELLVVQSVDKVVKDGASFNIVPGGAAVGEIFAMN